MRERAADILPELVNRGVRPDSRIDQTSAHDPPLRLFLPRLALGVSIRKTAQSGSPRDDAGSERSMAACSGDAGVQ